MFLRLINFVKIAFFCCFVTTMSDELTADQQQTIQRVLAADDDEIVKQCVGGVVTGKSIRTLTPGGWINDEIVNYMVHLFNEKERRKNVQTSTKRSYFFNSFFMPILLRNGTFDYANVAAWTVDGGDVFSFDKLFIPINNGVHWLSAIVFMETKTIQMYDSSEQNATRDDFYLRTILEYLRHEHTNKKAFPLPDGWILRHTPTNAPKQENGDDCGVFMLTCFYCVLYNQQLDFRQSHMDLCRQKIILSIMNHNI